jgi:hypothetical protein
VIPPTVGSSLLTPSHPLLHFSIPLTMPPRKQPPQQDPEEVDDDLVTGKQFKEMMDMMESLIASLNETFNKTTTSTNEMLHKSQASTETTHERMQRGIAAMGDRVQALETLLPIAATDPNATTADTHADGDPFAEDSEVDNDEHSELPSPPPRQRRPFIDKVWEVIKIITTNTMLAMMNLLLKLNFISLLLMAHMMLRLI